MEMPRFDRGYFAVWAAPALLKRYIKSAFAQSRKIAIAGRLNFRAWFYSTHTYALSGFKTFLRVV